MSNVSMQQLLAAGMHFGHQTRRWNPKMRRYIWGERSGIYVIDLVQAQALLEEARNVVGGIAQRGGDILFVGTKKQAQDAVMTSAERVGMPYVNHRWLGGLLTNWSTISGRLKHMLELRNQRDQGQLELLGAKEQQMRRAELKKLEQSLGGMAGMERLPQAVVVVDMLTEHLAVKEANRLGIPVIGLVDTNADPDAAQYVVPGNDDAIRSCSLFVETLADAISDAKTMVSAAEMEAEAAEGEDAETPAEAEAVGAGSTASS